MSLIIFLLLGIAHFLTGYGIIRLLKVQLAPVLMLSSSVITGIFLASLIPFLLQLAFIPLTPFTVFGCWAALLAVLLFLVFRQTGMQDIKLRMQYNLKLCEWPFLLLIGFILLITTWRCYFQPPMARDLLAGAEVIATFALREKTMINSVFTVDIGVNNNIFKSPFLVSLLLLYKMAGLGYGSLWLSLLHISFTCFIYSLLRKQVHPVIAGVLMLFLVSVAEMYAYSYLVLYDYSNMVFFFLGYFFMGEYLKHSQKNILCLSALLFSAATYARSETLILLLLLLPLLLINTYRSPLKSRMRYVLTNSLLLAVPSFVAYLVVIVVYNNHYLPVQYNVNGLMNAAPLELAPLWARLKGIWTYLLTGELSVRFYGYIFHAFSVLSVAGLIFSRRWSANALFWLYGILVVFAGLCLIGFMFPLMDVMNSTKRGFFKLFPLIICCLAANPMIQALSSRLGQWERGNTRKEPVVSAGKGK